MKNLAAVILAAALMPGLSVASTEQPVMPQAGVVINTAENMHSRSNTDTDVVSQALLGMNVKILKAERNAKGEDWYDIETPDTYKGWVVGSSLRLLKPGDKPYASTGKVFLVMSLFANTYREPDVTEHRPVKVVPISSVLELVRVADDRWLQIALPCGTKAWVQAGDGEIREAPWSWPRTTPDDMVALSKRFLGVPYLWGGTSPLGLDCSGFAQLIYKMCGRSILRDADIQFEGSGLEPVAPGDERAGDLVFFGRAKDKISHVGMMISTEEFINATTHEKPVVQISRLKDAYWQHIYQGARRAK